jgi:hypothetical protein
MLPLYAARIEDLGSGDFVKLDCAACQHVALLTPEALLRQGLRPAAKVLDLKGRLRCREAQPTAVPPWLHSAWTERAGSRFSVRRCEGTLYGAPCRRLAGLVSFGNLGMRDLRNA